MCVLMSFVSLLHRQVPGVGNLDLNCFKLANTTKRQEENNTHKIDEFIYIDKFRSKHLPRIQKCHNTIFEYKKNNSFQYENKQNSWSFVCTIPMIVLSNLSNLSSTGSTIRIIYLNNFLNGFYSSRLIYIVL